MLYRQLKNMAFPYASAMGSPTATAADDDDDFQLRVAVGYNGNLDLIVHDSQELMQELMKECVCVCVLCSTKQ